MELRAKVGIIGGTGVYDVQMLENARAVKLHTPYGNTSSSIILGRHDGVEIAFIPRHGEKHIHPPHAVPYRANIYALKQLGVELILAPMAVGSLRERIKPGDFVFPDQFIDNTRERTYTYYEGGEVAHVSMAEPFCATTRSILSKSASELGLAYHNSGTYICIQGPRFSTKAESEMYRMFGADVIGMTLVPEAQLAREKEICYQPICMVTDYDVWKERAVSVDEVIKTMKSNSENAKKLISASMRSLLYDDCVCRHALDSAVL